jgi:hypothetical protein
MTFLFGDEKIWRTSKPELKSSADQAIRRRKKAGLKRARLKVLAT